MTDKEILDEVYQRLVVIKQMAKGVPTSPYWTGLSEAVSFVEQEWQKRDEKEIVDQYNRNRSPKDWIVDVREMERHRGLEIGEDGTVKELK